MQLRKLKRCKKIYENIIFFNDLKTDQKENLFGHIESCADCKRYYDRIKHINKISAKHLDDDLLEHYALIISAPGETNYESEKLSVQNIDKIENHLNSCRICKDKTDKMQLSFQEMENYWQAENLPDLEINPVSRNNSNPIMAIRYWKLNFQKGKTLLNSLPTKKIAIAASIIVVSWIFLIRVNSPNYSVKDFARVEEIFIPDNTRGEINELQQAIIFFNEKNFENSINILNKFLQHEVDKNQNNYAKFLLGLAHMQLAQVSKGNFSLSQRRSLRFIAITVFSILADDVKQPQLLQENLWYLAKAFIHQEDVLNCKKTLKRIVSVNGSRSIEGKALLDELQNFY